MDPCCHASTIQTGDANDMFVLLADIGTFGTNKNRLNAATYIGTVFDNVPPFMTRMRSSFCVHFHEDNLLRHDWKIEGDRILE